MATVCSQSWIKYNVIMKNLIFHFISAMLRDLVFTAVILLSKTYEVQYIQYTMYNIYRSLNRWSMHYVKSIMTWPSSNMLSQNDVTKMLYCKVNFILIEGIYDISYICKLLCYWSLCVNVQIWSSWSVWCLPELNEYTLSYAVSMNTHSLVCQFC